MSKLYVGIDEVGVSSVAGPMVAAAVILPQNHGIKRLPVDSKDLGEIEIKELAEEIRNKAIYYKIVEADNLKVNEWGENKTIRKLWNKLSRIRQKKEYKNIEIIVDGSNKIPALKNDTKHKAIAKADAKFDNVSAAAIIAKDYCDNIMRELHKEFPMYNFAKNKGYGLNVSEHIEALKKYGLCKYHREKSVEKLLKTQYNLEYEKNNTDIDIYLLKEMVVCAGVILNKYPARFGPFVRRIFKAETPKILNGIKPSSKMQHCLSRSFLDMVRFACKDAYPKVDRSPIGPKSENIVKPKAINFFKNTFADEYESFTGTKPVEIPECIPESDIYSYDELYMMADIINTINVSMNKDIIPCIEECKNDIVGIFYGEIPLNDKQISLSDIVIDAMLNLKNCFQPTDQSMVVSFYKEKRFSKELYNIFEKTFWIEKEHFSFLSKKTVIGMMYVLGRINVNFGKIANVFKEDELAFCKTHYKNVINGNIPSMKIQLEINNLLMSASIRIFEHYAKEDIADRFRCIQVFSDEDVEQLVKEFDMILNNTKIQNTYNDFVLKIAS